MIQILAVIFLKGHQRGGDIYLIHCKTPSKYSLQFCPQYSCHNGLLISKPSFTLILTFQPQNHPDSLSSCCSSLWRANFTSLATTNSCFSGSVLLSPAQTNPTQSPGSRQAHAVFSSGRWGHGGGGGWTPSEVQQHLRVFSLSSMGFLSAPRIS